jgi:hypothetical protein
MSTDLANGIRAIVDAARPVTAADAIARSNAVATPHPPILGIDSGPDRNGRRAFAAAAVVLAGGAIAWVTVTSAPTPPRHEARNGAAHAKALLTASEIRQIVSHSTVAASSGTAQVTEETSEAGTPQTDNSIAVTFDGQNIDEKITVVAEPPGSAQTFTTDDRLVDGQFYIYTPGPGDVLEWMHDTDSANDVASMQFPDPRTLYGVISASAQFEVAGTTTVDGATLTRLVALDPAAIDASALGNLAQGTLSSFEMTVDGNDVVQQMTFGSAENEQVCRFTGSAGQLKHLLEKEFPASGGQTIEFSRLLRKEGALAIARGGGAVRLTPAAGPRAATSCGPQTFSSQVSIAFANLGQPESITAPQGAINYAGKG